MGSLQAPISLSPSLLPSPIDSPSVKKIIAALSLDPHPEGGAFALSDRSEDLIQSPFPSTPASAATLALAPPSLIAAHAPIIAAGLRAASSVIYYYLHPSSPVGHFHRNRCRIVHSLHRGRGRYVLIRSSGEVESFIVGTNVAKGERCQWIVEGGDWKASFLLPDDEEGEELEGVSGKNNAKQSGGLLITEVCVPGFEYVDHEFLTTEVLRDTMGEEKATELEWLVRKA